MKALILSTVLVLSPVEAFLPNEPRNQASRCGVLLHHQMTTTESSSPNEQQREDRRAFLSNVVTTASALVTAGSLAMHPQPAQAVGPVKVSLKPTSYKAAPCPPSKPIPGEKAMFGMRGLCVTVQADLLEETPKDLEKVGVYGFVIDGETGNSVLANNPDLR